MRRFFFVTDMLHTGVLYALLVGLLIYRTHSGRRAFPNFRDVSVSLRWMWLVSFSDEISDYLQLPYITTWPDLESVHTPKPNPFAAANFLYMGFCTVLGLCDLRDHHHISRTKSSHGDHGRMGYQRIYPCVSPSPYSKKIYSWHYHSTRDFGRLWVKWCHQKNFS